MILFDAILACGSLYFFGENALMALGITCMITFLRMAMKFDTWFRALELAMKYLYGDDNFNKEER